MIKSRFFASLLLIASLNLITTQSKGQHPEIRSQDISGTISTLASEAYQGRKPGTKGDSLSTEYILSRFKKAGLKLLFENGKQDVKIVKGFKRGEQNSLKVNNHPFEVGKDFEPLPFSGNSNFAGKVAFAGYGLKLKNDSVVRDDYSSLKPDNQWIMFLDGLPADLQKIEGYKKQADLRTKVLHAIDQNAKGILIVYHTDTITPLSKAVVFDKNSSQYDIPVIMISAQTALAILGSNSSDNLEDIVKISNNKEFKPYIIEKNIIDGEASVFHDEVKTYNLAGFIPGKDKTLANEYIVIGAHYDHLGFGGPMSGSRMPDTSAVHYGADDNASGVAAVIELAEKMAKEKKNKRSIIFATFGAEELGLIGSKAFVAQPPVALGNIGLMVNFDMVGRLDSAKHLTVGGVGTSIEARAIIDSLNPGFDLLISEDGYGPSDHASFYSENIPVLYFTSGVHEQYHTPFDTFNRINSDGEKDIIAYAEKIVSVAANRPHKFTYRESGPKNGTNERTTLKVTLGIMPDFSGVEKNGLRIDGVTPGKVAAKSGLKKGDIITAIDGKKVGNIYDYMNRMKEFSPGQIISVDVLREGKSQIFIINL